MAIATVFCLSSCDSRGDAVIEQLTDESELLKELSAFNQSVSFSQTKYSDIYYGQGTTPKRLTKRQLANIVVADIGGAMAGGEAGAILGAKLGSVFFQPLTGATFGAFVGALGVGAANSWRAAPDLPNEDQEISENNDDNIDPFFDRNSPYYHTYLSRYHTIVDISEEMILEEEEIVDEVVVDEDVLGSVELSGNVLEIGLMHNVILSLLYGDIEVEEEENHPQTKSAVGVEPNLEDAILNSPEMEEMLSNVSVEEWMNNGSMPSSVIKLFSNILETYPDDNYDIVFLINKYHHIIEQSTELTSDEKQWINLGLAVSLYSYNYWNTKLN